MKNIAITFGCLSVFLIYISFSSPDGLVIDERGDIVGSFNQLREKAQGKSFWRKQLEVAESGLKWEISEPGRRVQFHRDMDEVFEKMDGALEEMYRNYPDMRPTKAERQAESLREKADEIEQIEFGKELDKMRRERISELRKIIPLIRLKTL